MFKKNKPPKQAPTTRKHNNWYTDRYQNLCIQRNLWAVVAIIAVLSSLYMNFIAIHASTNKSIDPYVIEVDERSGLVNVVQPLNIEVLSKDKAMQRYFLVKYLQARERDQDNDTVRILSTNDVFRKYNVGLNNSRSTPLTNQHKSITIVGEPVIGKQDGRLLFARIEFTLHTKGRDKRLNLINTSDKKVATIRYVAAGQIGLTRNERDINPVGFQVHSYELGRR